MRLSTDYYQPSELTDLARELQNDVNRPKDTDYRFQRDFLPSTYEHDVDYRIKAGVSGIPSSAKFRAFDAESAIGARPGFSELSGSLPAVGERRLITEADRLRMRRNSDEGFRRALAEETAAAQGATEVRVERAIVSTFLTGKTTLTNERGLTVEADWARPSSHSVTGSNWRNPTTGTPLTDLANAQEVYDSEGVIVMTTPTMRSLTRSEEFRKLGSTTLGTPGVVTPEFVGQVLAARGFTLVTYDAKFINDAGAEERILPNGNVLFAPTPGSSAAGQTVWGITAEAMSAGYDIDESEHPGIVVGHYLNDHPVQDWIVASAVAFPVLANPKRTLALKVSA